MKGWLLAAVVGSVSLVVSSAQGQDQSADQVLFPKKDAVVQIDAKTKATALEIHAPCYPREIKGPRLQVRTTKGWGWVERSQMLTADEAAKYCQTLVSAKTPDPYGLLLRAGLASQNDQLDKALADLTAAIAADPKFAMAYTTRGWLYVDGGQHDKALSDFSTAAKLAPRDPLILNNLAWFKATCPADKFRDGKQAVESAKQACELTEYKHEEFLNTLAASLAETGDFKGAVKWATKAVELDPKNEEFASHLKLYQSGKPYRDVPQVAEKPTSDKPATATKPATTTKPTAAKPTETKVK